ENSDGEKWRDDTNSTPLPPSSSTMPPGFPPLVLPQDGDTTPGDVDVTNTSGLDTEPDGETVTVGEGDLPAPETPESSQWKRAYDQLSVQLDRASFDTWLRAARFVGYDAETLTFVIGVPNSYSRDMLQHRMYRDIRRVLADATGLEAVEMRFEVVK